MLQDGGVKAPVQLAKRLAILVTTLSVGCATVVMPGIDVIPRSSSEVLAEVRALERSGGDPSGEQRRALLGEVSLAQPEWVGPERLLDLLELSELRGVEVLARRRSALNAARGREASARASYLLGRLGGDATAGLMRECIKADPSFAWGLHGGAWSAREDDRTQDAIELERRAISRARDPFDRALFTLSLAELLRVHEDAAAAYEELKDEQLDASLFASDAVWFRAQRASFGMRLEEGRDLDDAWEELLEVLPDPLLGENDALRLAKRARAARREHRGLDPYGLRLDQALAMRSEESLLFERAHFAHECGRHVRAAALWEGLSDGEWRAPARERRLANFAVGSFGRAVDVWLEGLPSFVLGDSGLPKSERLAAVVTAARAATPGSAEALQALGEACLSAGWFDEAYVLAPHLAALDSDAAQWLSERAERGFSLLAFFDRSLGHELQPIPDSSLEIGDEWLGIHRFLHSLNEEVQRSAALFEPEVLTALRSSLALSPIYSFSPFAALVHPGPSFSAQDELLDVGERGAPVPGLGVLGEAIGRFILLGQLSGRERADGAVFPVLWSERRSGEHVGVEWSGSVVWCEGIEPVGWLGRNSTVTGAALHDGFWVDVESVRREHARWLALQREWTIERAERSIVALAPRAFNEGERRALRPLLGAGERVRLSIFVDRDGAVPTHAELLEGVSRHEEGHLVDRALHMPLSSHPLRVVKLLGSVGFDPPAVLERLEYRAQLVALCETEDPRLILSDSLMMVESAPPSARAHARGYEALLNDLIELLDEELQADPAAWPALDPERVLVHQLHLLKPGEVRALARALAREVGLP